MENVLLKPLGQVLEEAGLVSDEQIKTALEIQSKYSQFKFGTILVTLGILKHKTVDFFIEQFPKLLQQPKIYPLGYYLEKAALINVKQIEIILQEQKRTGRFFGELIVAKGWLKAKTINFFLKHLSNSKKKGSLLATSSQERVESFNSNPKTAQAASHYSLLKEVFFWTGGHPLLTQHICQIISNSNEFVPSGVEVIWVEKLVQDQVIENWENQKLGGFLTTIQNYILNNKQCSPVNLLKLYLRVLQQEEVKINDSQEKQELINSGLVIQQNGQFKISNRIYQSIFNSDWVEEQLLKIEKRSSIVPSKAIKIIQNNRIASAAIKLKNEPFTQVAALTIVLGLLLTSPIIIFLNNVHNKAAQINENIESQENLENLESKLLSEPPLISQSPLCNASIPPDSATREDWRIHLEQKQQQLQQEFPAKCQKNLDKLIILNALRLGKENRVLDGINYLCRINTASESFNQARFWLNRWYNSPDWGQQTQYYLKTIENCPVAENLLSVKF